MGSIRSLFARTARIGWAVVGLACALMVLEVQRMPVTRFVSFFMFALLPYAVEAAGDAGHRRSVPVRGALRVSDLRAVRVTVALLSAAATWLLLSSPWPTTALALAACAGTGWRRAAAGPSGASGLCRWARVAPPAHSRPPACCPGC